MQVLREALLDQYGALDAMGMKKNVVNGRAQLLMETSLATEGSTGEEEAAAQRAQPKAEGAGDAASGEQEEGYWEDPDEAVVSRVMAVELGSLPSAPTFKALQEALHNANLAPQWRPQTAERMRRLLRILVLIRKWYENNAEVSACGVSCRSFACG